MNAVSLIKAMIDSGGRTPGSPGGRFHPGERLLAKVLDVGKDGMVRLDLGRFTAMASLHAPLKAGMVLPLEVVESAGQLLLRLRERKERPAPPSPPALSGDTATGDTDATRRQLYFSLRQLRGTDRWESLPSARKGLPHLMRLLTPMDPQSDSVKAVAMRIRESIEDSGLFLEHRLARSIAPPRQPIPPPLSGDRGPEYPAPSMVARSDAKAVILQILADLKQAAVPLPEAMVVLKENAARLLSAIQGQQRHAAHRGLPADGRNVPLVYGPHRAPLAAQPMSAAADSAGSLPATDAWWRVTGVPAPPANKTPDPKKAGLPEAAVYRRHLLASAESLAQSLARTDGTRPPSEHAHQAAHVLRMLRAYTRVTVHRDTSGISTQWRRLERLASTLAKRLAPATMPNHPQRVQRLSAALARMLRDELDRFDADLGTLNRMIRGHAGDDNTSPGRQRRAGSARGESGLMFEFTIPVTTPHQPARLHVYYPPRKRAGGRSSHEVALLLSLKPMGNIRASVSLRPEGLRVVMHMAEERALQLAIRHQATLETALASLAPSVKVDTRRQVSATGAEGEAPWWERSTANTTVNVDV